MKIQSVGGILDPNIEKIVSLNPDVVITNGMQTNEVLKKLKDNNIAVADVTEDDTIEGIYKEITNVGCIVNKSKEAETLVGNLVYEAKSIESKTKNVPNKRKVFFCLSVGNDGIYTAGNDTFINDILTYAGAINVASDVSGWNYSLEKLYENDPDIIICSNKFNVKNSIIKYEPLKNLRAIKQDQVLEIDDNLIMRKGIRNIESIKQIAKLAYNINV